MTYWKRPWCWERLKVGGERDDRGWDGWMASVTRWTLSLSKLWALVMDREAWFAAVHRVTKSRTQLSNWTESNQPPVKPGPRPVFPTGVLKQCLFPQLFRSWKTVFCITSDSPYVDGSRMTNTNLHSCQQPGWSGQCVFIHWRPHIYAVLQLDFS